MKTSTANEWCWVRFAHFRRHPHHYDPPPPPQTRCRQLDDRPSTEYQHYTPSARTSWELTSTNYRLFVSGRLTLSLSLTRSDTIGKSTEKTPSPPPPPPPTSTSATEFFFKISSTVSCIETTWAFFLTQRGVFYWDLKNNRSNRSKILMRDFPKFFSEIWNTFSKL